ncbi:MAG: hypothetical protein ACT4TC_10290, partial [Myxococcaceae bacterium]
DVNDVPGNVDGPNNARWVVIGFVALIVGFVLYAALGMPGMDHGGDPQMDHVMEAGLGSGEDSLPGVGNR